MDFDFLSLLAPLGVAVVLGARHASDPDHLVAVTSLVAADDGDVRRASRLGAWWGAGHALTLVMIGAPLILLRSELPGWLESGSETAVGLVIVALALRLALMWARGERPTARGGAPREAFAIGTLHGLAGTGAVVLLLIAGMGSREQAVVALAVFAPMSVLSMALCTSAFAWVLGRPSVEAVRQTALIPALGGFGLLFGVWLALAA